MRDCSIATAVLIRARRAYERKVRARKKAEATIVARVLLKDINKWSTLQRVQASMWLRKVSYDVLRDPPVLADRFDANLHF